MPEHAKRFDDDELPQVCQREGAVALLTNNRHDFSVEIALYQALIEAEVSAVVLRLPNSRIEKPDLSWLTARVLKHLGKIIRELDDADQSLLLTVRKDRVKINPVRELLHERLS